MLTGETKHGRQPDKIADREHRFEWENETAMCEAISLSLERDMARHNSIRGKSEEKEEKATKWCCQCHSGES